MPGEANATYNEIKVLKEKLKNAKDPVEIAKIQDAIKELEERLRK